MVSAIKCCSCKEVKPSEAFSPDLRRPSGRQYRCKECFNLERRRKYTEDADYRERVKAHNKEQVRKRPDLANARAAKWARANAEKRAKSIAAWAAANPDKRAVNEQRRRAAKRSTAENSLTTDEWEALCASYLNRRCVYCGDDGPMTIDHIVPLSSGGSNSVDNVAPACKACNSKKWKHNLLTFLYRSNVTAVQGGGAK